MIIIRRAAVDCFSNLRLDPTNKRKQSRTSVTCPICSNNASFTYRKFEKAHDALNQKSVFSMWIKQEFDMMFPLQKIDSVIMGRKMSLYLEYTLDYYCKKCGAPLRILFCTIEREQGLISYMIKSMLGPGKRSGLVSTDGERIDNSQV